MKLKKDEPKMNSDSIYTSISLKSEQKAMESEIQDFQDAPSILIVVDVPTNLLVLGEMLKSNGLKRDLKHSFFKA